MPVDVSKLARGLYVVTRPKWAGLVTHVGLVDVGNQLSLEVRAGAGPVVLHQPPTGLVAVYAADAGQWGTAVRVTNVAGVRERVAKAFEDRTYDLFGNNCEHFITFALSGERLSPQLRTVLTIAGVAIGVALLFGAGGPATRRA
jgi:hypothetical protein